MKEMKRIIKALLVFTLAALLFACGVTSNNSSSGGGSPSASASSIQTMSPGELARIQNQKAMELTPQTFDAQIQNLSDADTVKVLYYDLGNRNPAIRKRSHELLTELVNYDEKYLDELRKIQTDNEKPDNWYEVSQILADTEKSKSKQKEAQMKQWLGE